MMLDDDMVPEEDPRYESEDERVEVRHRERPVGPPLEVEVPFRLPPGDPEKVYLLYVAKIFSVDMRINSLVSIGFSFLILLLCGEPLL